MLLLRIVKMFYAVARVSGWLVVCSWPKSKESLRPFDMLVSRYSSGHSTNERLWDFFTHFITHQMKITVIEQLFLNRITCSIIPVCVGQDYLHFLKFNQFFFLIQRRFTTCTNKINTEEKQTNKKKPIQSQNKPCI